RIPATTKRRCRGSQAISERLTQVFCAWAEITLSPSRSSARSLSRWLRADIASAYNPPDVGTAGSEFIFEPLEPAVEMIDAVDDGFAFRRQARDDQGHRSAQVR